MTQFRAGFWPDPAPSSAAKVRQLDATRKARKDALDKFLEGFVEGSDLDPRKRKAILFSWMQGLLEDD